VKCLENIEPLFYIPFFKYSIGITINLVVQWGIILMVTLVSVLLTRNLKKIPDKKQSALEALVEFINNQIKENMGEGYRSFSAYIGSVAIFLLLMNLAGLLRITIPTESYSVALGMALTTFLVIQGYVIYKKGILGYFKGYSEPYAFMLPMNVIERFMLPLSLSLRLFGNMTAAGVIMALVYKALGGLGWAAQIGIPIPLQFYFDLFDGVIQMVIFTMLTMVNIKIIAEH